MRGGPGGQCCQHVAWERRRAVFAAVGAKVGLEAPGNPVSLETVIRTIEIGEQS